LRNVAADRWDRIGFFWHASPKVINQKLGFSWDHPDATKVDLFDGRDLVLFVVVRGTKVVDHALIPEKELSSCAGSLMVARENAVFVSKGDWVCPESGPPPGRRFRKRPPQ
jgi:hypothetical protein